MDKQTLSNYGWIVICILVLCVMIALATPFGSFIAGAVKSTAQGLFDVNQKAFNNVGFGQIPDQSIEDSYDGNGTGGAGDETPVKPEIPEYDHNASELHPDDGSTPVNGDTYECGDYIYTYQTSSNGWKVAINTAVTDKNQAEYGPVLESINGEPVTDMDSTFSECASLTVAPVIPSSVTNMRYTFNGCKSLTTAPIIPSGVTNMIGTFNACASLETYAGSTDADGDFSGYVIPNGITGMTATFWGCTPLTAAPVIPSSVISMVGTFYGCKSLTVAPVIPNGVKDMGQTFMWCTSLTTAPVIPNGVTNMYRTFYDCVSLTGEIEINANPTDYDDCFYNTILPITITGSCSIETKVALAGTANNGNATYEGAGSEEVALEPGLYETGTNNLIMSWDKILEEGILVDYQGLICGGFPSGLSEEDFKGDLVIPDNVTTIFEGTFWRYSGLTGIKIPDSVTRIGESAFNDCTSLTSVIIGNGLTEIVDCTFMGCTSLTSINIPNSVTSIGGRVFYSCTNLQNISFSGTTAEWNAIEKDAEWNFYASITYIQCSDGQVALT